jgi:16S rRNA (adenine1518-N6/adenine1519-N6)-dimethyltransferase
MAQTKHEIQALLAGAELSPRHRWGQNFMIDQNLVRLVADAGQICPGDLVIEVGPGTGTLTEELLARGANILAVEIDRGLAKLLKGRFESSSRFALIEDDALAGKHALHPQLLQAIIETKQRGQTVRTVANLPYSVASPLVVELLIAGVDVIACTVQKEVAARLRAGAGSEAYGALSVMVQLLAGVELLRTLPSQVFWPAPAVESALVRLSRQDRLGPRAPAVGTFVHKLFAARRKTLKRALEQAGADPASVLASTGISGQIRPEELTPAQALALFEASK